MSKPPSPFVLTTLVGAIFLTLSSGRAEAESTRRFEIAAGDATDTLKFFADQSNEQLVYPAREVSGIRTNAVSGTFTPLAALRKMLSGTALSVLYDARTGALSIKREPDPNDCRAAPGKAQGDRPNPREAAANRPGNSLGSLSATETTPDKPMKQSSSTFKRVLALGAALAASIASTSGQIAPKADSKGLDDEAVTLQPFEVVMTQDKGYHTPYSGSALKTNEDIMKIPQSVTVITRDMIDDIASFDLSDMLNYVAVGNFQQGDSAYVRGNAANLNTDGAGDGSPSMMPDSATIDSITIVRGPIAVLYGGNSSITGAVVRQTRVPLEKRQTTVKGQADEWGFHRFELDDTGPLGRIGEARFSYRLDLAYQGGKTFLRNIKQDRKIYFGVVQMKYKDTTLRLNAQYQDLRQPPHKNNPATPDGLPWLGAGRDEGFFDTASMLHVKIRTLRMAWIQRFSPDWAFTSYGTMNNYRYGPQSVLLLDQIDFQRQVVRYLARNNNAGVQAYNAGGDLNGTYKLFGREFRTSLGFSAWNSRRRPYDHFANPDFGSQNADVGTPVKSSASAFGFDRLEIPFANVTQALARIHNIPYDQYRLPPTATLGTLVDTTETNVYFQQNAELIPHRLIVTGAISQINNYATSRNYTPVPLTSVTTTASENRNNRVLHRYGVVLNVTKNIALYGVETTNVVFINSSSRTATGEFIPPRDGEMREAGIKASFLDGRISATAAIYNTYYKNWAVSRTGGVIPEFGYNVFDLVKDSYIKGWDFSLAARPLPTWQLLFNCTAQDPRIQATNTRLPSSNRGSWSVFTSYKFTNDALHKFRIGGGANRFYSRLTGASGLILPNGVVGSSAAAGATGGQLNLADGTMTTAFIEYAATRRLSLKLNVNNVLDEVMVMGAQNWGAVDPSQPRTFSLIATYRF